MTLAASAPSGHRRQRGIVKGSALIRVWVRETRRMTHVVEAPHGEGVLWCEAAPPSNALFSVIDKCHVEIKSLGTDNQIVLLS